MISSGNKEHGRVIAALVGSHGESFLLGPLYFCATGKSTPCNYCAVVKAAVRAKMMLAVSGPLSALYLFSFRARSKLRTDGVGSAMFQVSYMDKKKNEDPSNGPSHLEVATVVGPPKSIIAGPPTSIRAVIVTAAAPRRWDEKNKNSKDCDPYDPKYMGDPTTY